jgi:dihydrodipicolinate synthase/N-acetylneuraminate lyase
MLLSGIFAPITTPFYADGRLYHRKLQQNVETYCKAPISGLVALGSTGEAVMLSDDERREVLREVRGAAAKEKVLIAGTGAESALETLKLTEYAASLEYDAALVRTPHFYKPQMRPENILTFYRTVADRAPLPVLIYSVPVFTGYDMPLELVVELAGHPNIIGIKESSGNVEKISKMAEVTRHVHREVQVTEVFEAVTARMMNASNHASEKIVPVAALGAESKTTVAAKPKFKTRTKDAGFQVLSGSAHVLHDSLQTGAAGAVIAFADAAPTACFEIYAAWKDRDERLAREKQQRIVEAAKRVVSYYGVPGIKYAQDLNGYYGGPARLPLLPLTAEAKAEIERLMAGLR